MSSYISERVSSEWAAERRQDQQALDVIASILDGNEWDADACQAVADQVRTTGRIIGEPNG